MDYTEQVDTNSCTLRNLMQRLLVRGGGQDNSLRQLTT